MSSRISKSNGEKTKKRKKKKKKKKTSHSKGLQRSKSTGAGDASNVVVFGIINPHTLSVSDGWLL